MPAAAIINKQPLLDDDHQPFLGLGRDERAIGRPADIINIKRTSVRICTCDAKAGEVVRRSTTERPYIGNLFAVPVQRVAVRPLTLVGDSEYVHLVCIVARVQNHLIRSLHGVCADKEGT